MCGIMNDFLDVKSTEYSYYIINTGIEYHFMLSIFKDRKVVREGNIIYYYNEDDTCIGFHKVNKEEDELWYK